jgi:drug/metabolite transporter (DMT)-like permease
MNKPVKVKKMSVLLIILGCVIVGVFGQLSMKRGLNEIGVIGLTDIFSSRFFTIIFQKYVFIGVFLYMLASLLWLVALSQAELSFAYPLISIGYVFTAILAWFLFGEKLTFFKIFGILMICGGVYVIVLKL